VQHAQLELARAVKSGRDRLDSILVQRGLASSRNRAQAVIRAGEVTVNGHRFDKPGMTVPLDSVIEVREPPPYVGRGGLKLEAALAAFEIDPRDRSCLDVGASTGGFTDCLLQRGARQVFAVDVGRAQLAWPLRQDARVINMERTDIRRVSSLPLPIELAVIDVAFISLRLVLPSVAPLLGEGADLIALVKPQFEAGRDRVGRGGIVRDPEVHREVLQEVLAWSRQQGWRARGLMDSPIQGSAGNREFLLWLDRESNPSLGAESASQELGLDWLGELGLTPQDLAPQD
jgi:23S rRNA (cytidine1920-2'-O)/16S rRNA (cytidine1409-2'-O)-methyltransferase